MLHNLDTRLRAQEGKVSTYFFEQNNPFAVELEKANTFYDSKKPAKGQPHELGPRRTTLAGAFLLALSKCDLTLPSMKPAIDFFNKIATTLQNPTIEQQKAILVELMAAYSSPKNMEMEISQCLFFNLCPESALP